jgi:cysteine desulfurase/selenocysteine lyase
MSTSDPNESLVPRETDAGALTKQIEQLANEFFKGAPSTSGAPWPGAIVPPGVGPNALHVGAGGLSPAASLPPVPGPLHSPPLAASPLPKESDLRAIPTLLSEQLGTPSAIALASSAPADASQPYFLGLAGLPVAPSDATSPTPALPGSMDRSFQGLAPAPVQASPPAFPSGSPGDAVQGLPGDPLQARHGAPAHGLSGAPLQVPQGAPLPASPRIRREEHAEGTRVRDGGRSGETSSLPESSLYDFRPEVTADIDRGRGLFDPNAIKRDFPILAERVHGRPLVWLDNAATTQKPQSVIDRLTHFYEHENSNVHRAAHTLAGRATDAYEAARDKVRRFINAPSPKEIVFVRGTTEAINLVAQSWGRRNVGPGDEIVITWLEHHANIVPWQLLCSEKGARLRVAPVDDDGQVILDEYERLLGPRTRLVSITQVSNALGTIVPAREMVAMAHRRGALALVDGAQSTPHMPVDVQELDCDFFCFSGHKVFGPTGIGALFGKREILDAMPPWQGGGNMIADVTFQKTTYQPAPLRFEAGTGNIADAVGLGAALDYLSAIGLENIHRYEHELRVYAEGCLATVPGLRMIGNAREKAGVLSFVLDGVRTEDVGAALDQEGIAVRSGHHCAQPILRRFGLEATVRASLAPYNTREDIDALVAALRRLQAGRPAR